jgi:hypothetical protein
MLNDETRERVLIVLLRLAGAITLTAFFAIFLPTGWMAATHRWLGLGEFPDAPIVQYLTRTIAALYGFQGVLLLLVARDPVRYRAVISYIAVMNVVFGLIAIGVDLYAGMPHLWTLLEGPPVIVFGIVIAGLNRQVSR